jgi:SAM-dependent methyltransferase
MSERPLPTAQATFRDPEGRVFEEGDQILREVYPQHVEAVLAWMSSPLAQRWMEQGRLTPTKVLESEPGKAALLEHERIFFPSFPWEWTPGQWVSAATLTLDLCEEAIEQGVILKDATPLNVLFRGPQAIFVDLLSFERRDPESPLWVAYAQFVRSFLLPLCAHRDLGWPLGATIQLRDGYEPAHLAPFLPLLKRARPPLLSLITLPLLLEKLPQIAARRPVALPEVSILALRRTLRSARRMLNSLAPVSRSSRWSGYMKSATHYTAEDHTLKQAFVRRSLEAMRPGFVLDVGANTGVYSRIAAEAGAEVVSWDTDLESTEVNWRTALQLRLRILPLVVDFARPTPAVGWKNKESASLLDRARGKFDCVMMLGIVHHLLIADQIPLDAILDQLAEITTRWAILEWIPKEDREFIGLARGRMSLHEHLSEAAFTALLASRFAVRAREQLPNCRTVWLLEATG